VIEGEGMSFLVNLNPPTSVINIHEDLVLGDLSRENLEKVASKHPKRLTAVHRGFVIVPQEDGTFQLFAFDWNTQTLVEATPSKGLKSQSKAVDQIRKYFLSTTIWRR